MEFIGIFIERVFIVVIIFFLGRFIVSIRIWEEVWFRVWGHLIGRFGLFRWSDIW